MATDDLTDDTLPESLIGRLDSQVSAVIRKYRGTRTGKYGLLLPTALVLFLLMLLPSLILVNYSLGPLFWDGFTLEYFQRALTTDVYRDFLIRTVKVSAAVTIMNFLIGFPLAYAATRGSTRLGRVIVVMTLAPLAIDLVVRSFGWFLLLSSNGMVSTLLVRTGLFTQETVPQLLYNETAIVIGLGHVMLPFMVFPIINVLHTIPESMEEAAQDLGANRITVFTRILLPLALPGIAAGTLITFVGSMASYVTPAILGGGSKVLAVSIVETFRSSGDWPFASALALELLVVAVVVMVVYQKLLKRIGGIGGA